MSDDIHRCLVTADENGDRTTVLLQVDVPTERYQRAVRLAGDAKIAQLSYVQVAARHMTDVRIDEVGAAVAVGATPTDSEETT